MSQKTNYSMKTKTKLILLMLVSFFATTSQKTKAQQIDLKLKSADLQIDQIATINSVLKNGGNPSVMA